MKKKNCTMLLLIDNVKPKVQKTLKWYYQLDVITYKSFIYPSSVLTANLDFLIRYDYFISFISKDIRSRAMYISVVATGTISKYCIFFLIITLHKKIIYTFKTCNRNFSHTACHIFVINMKFKWLNFLNKLPFIINSFTSICLEAYTGSSKLFTFSKFQVSYSLFLKFQSNSPSYLRNYF